MSEAEASRRPSSRKSMVVQGGEENLRPKALNLRENVPFKETMRSCTSCDGPQAKTPTIEASGKKAIREGADRAAVAADQTTRAFHEKPAERAATVSISSASRDLASATVEMMGAKAELKAGVKVLQVGDELTQETLRLMDHRR